MISAANVSRWAGWASPTTPSSPAAARSRPRSALACPASAGSRSAAVQARAAATSSGQTYRGLRATGMCSSAAPAAAIASAGRSWAVRTSVSSRASAS